MLKLNFFGRNYCPNKVRSYHLDFPVNLIKITTSDAKDNTQYKKICFFYPQHLYILLVSYLNNLNRNN